MKKLLIIVIMLFYGFSSSGMTLQLHYCCGKLKNIDWKPVEQKSCGNEQKMHGKACCETKQLISASSEHYNQQPEFPSFQVLDGWISYIHIYKDNFYFISEDFVPEIFAPPVNPTKIFIRHCDFRI